MLTHCLVLRCWCFSFFLFQFICFRIFFSAVASCAYFAVASIASPLFSLWLCIFLVLCLVSSLGYVGFCLPYGLGLSSHFLSCLKACCVSPFIFNACNLDCGLLFSLPSAWGLFLECFRFVRCALSGGRSHDEGTAWEHCPI